MINDDEIEFKATGFDYVNPTALVVLVGITPGNTQLLGSRCGKTFREIKRWIWYNAIQILRSDDEARREPEC